MLLATLALNSPPKLMFKGIFGLSNDSITTAILSTDRTIFTKKVAPYP
jgi:hypothetical protein